MSAFDPKRTYSRAVLFVFFYIPFMSRSDSSKYLPPRRGFLHARIGTKENRETTQKNKKIKFEVRR
jgi:hypothetical protein